MKIAYIGTYPPRECGIGTFTQNLVSSMLCAQPGGQDEGFVIAINDHDLEYEYPSEVKMTITQDRRPDYLDAVNYINNSGADICILEHEFGIFGGQSGIYILSLLHRLKVPLIVTLHTILKVPSYNERAILVEISKMADKLVVMSHQAVDFLMSIYEVPEEKIAFIQHGVPDLQFDHFQSKKELKLEQKKLLLTFGFLGRNKGIETVIKALPVVIEKHPTVLYMVLGKTHPNIFRHSGEEYRTYLQQLVQSLQLTDHVLFINEYIEENDLFKYLAATDIYITPYLNEAQITSGTLTYAMGAGCAVISTPYWYANELLEDGRGKLFDFNNSDQLSSILNDVLDHPDSLHRMQEKAREYGKNLTWPKTGKKYQKLAADMVNRPVPTKKKEELVIDLHRLPPFSLAHIRQLTDNTGIIQHARYGIPNLKEGYCLDDNARALLMSLMAYKLKKEQLALDFIAVYLGYIHYLQRKNGFFGNFLSFNRSFLDEIGSEDSFGRTIWALGYLLGNPPNDSFYQAGKLVFFDAVPNFEKLESIRSIADTMIGMSYYIKSNPSDDEMLERLRNMALKLVKQYHAHKTPTWRWFEPVMAYDNGILPLALLHAAELLHDDEINKVAIESMDFLTDTTMKEGYLSVIGNKSWYKQNGHRSIYAQQPIDALAMVLMYHQAFHLTKNKDYLHKLFTAFMWFLGENDLRMSLYDAETNGCCDGFESYGVNRNQGAESSLAYLISHLTVLEAHEEFLQTEA